MTDNIVLLDDIKKNREDVVTDSYTSSWREIVNLYKDGDIIISPDYQRLFRWDNDRQSEFIESLILNIPVPSLFLYIRDDGRQEVIDGLQRISSIIRFFADDVFGAEGTTRGGEVNDIRNPTTLGETQLVKSLEGYSARTLPDKIIRTIRNARVNISLLEQESKPSTRFHVFRRLNRSGVKLSDQEIRNCTARLIDKKFPDELRRIGENPIIRKALKLSVSQLQSQKVEEVVLRLLAVVYAPELFDHRVDNFLDEVMERASENALNLDSDYESKLVRTFSLLHKASPAHSVFKHGNQFSSNLVDIIASGVYKNIDNLTTRQVADGLNRLKSEPEFDRCTGAGSNTKSKLQARLQLGERVFS